MRRLATSRIAHPTQENITVMPTNEELVELNTTQMHRIEQLMDELDAARRTLVSAGTETGTIILDLERAKEQIEAGALLLREQQERNNRQMLMIQSRDEALVNRELTIEADQALIRALQEQLEEEKREHHASRQAHSKDIDIIGQTMLDAAERYSMCEQYDAVVAQLIGMPDGTKLHRLPERTKKCRFTTRFTIDIDCFAEHTRASFDQAEEDDEYKITVDQLRSMLSIATSEDFERKIDVIEQLSTSTSWDVS